MIKQLGPIIIFLTFTIGANNWPILVKILKYLHIQHVQNLNLKNEDLLNIKNLVKNDLIICVPYYENRMNSFQKLLNNNNNLLKH
jgi:hypothetical protein